MPWNPEHYMKKEEVMKILEDNKITNVEKNIKSIYINSFQKKIDSHVYHEPKSNLHYNVIKPQTDKFLEQWNIPKSESVLDIGCGDGYFLSLLKEKGYANILGITKSDKDMSYITDLPYAARSEPNSVGTIVRYGGGNNQTIGTSEACYLAQNGSRIKFDDTFNTGTGKPY